ncbi:MAG: PIN domain-containing protein [Spirochaetota bacterium]
MVAYLDTSVVLQHILRGDIAIRHAFAVGRVVTSELTRIESCRVIHRYRLHGDLDDDGLVAATDRLDAVLAGVAVADLSRAVRTRAMGSFPVVVGTLDALHLATALLYAESYLDSAANEQVLVFSHDVAMNRCAAALGFPVPLRGE